MNMYLSLQLLFQKNINMKKLVLFLTLALMCFPATTFADKYDLKKIGSLPGIPIRTPGQNIIGLYLNENTGDLVISPNYNITNLNITIIGNGATYLNTTVSLSAGQSYTDCLDYLTEGTYILTLSTVDGVIDQYEITVEED